MEESNRDRRFTRQALEVIETQKNRLLKTKMGYVGWIFFLGLGQVVEGVASNVYKYGVTYKVVFDIMSSDVILHSGSVMSMMGKKKAPELTSRVEALLEQAIMIAKRQGLEKAGTEQILLAIIADEECQSHMIMVIRGVELKKMCRDILKLRKHLS